MWNPTHGTNPSCTEQILISRLGAWRSRPCMWITISTRSQSTSCWSHELVYAWTPQPQLATLPLLVCLLSCRFDPSSGHLDDSPADQPSHSIHTDSAVPWWFTARLVSSSNHLRCRVGWLLCPSRWSKGHWKRSRTWSRPTVLCPEVSLHACTFLPSVLLGCWCAKFQEMCVIFGPTSSAAANTTYILSFPVLLPRQHLPQQCTHSMRTELKK